MIDGAREELARRIGDLLQRERLGDGVEIESYSSPRRLAVVARGLLTSQPDMREQMLGPSLKVAYKDGQPTPAAQAFAKKAGVDPSALEKVSTPKGEYIAATVSKKGRPAAEIISEFLPKELDGIYWAKSMYWRPGRTNERFVRPVRWLVAILDGKPVPVEFDGIPAGNTTRGHRLLAKEDVKLTSADCYRKTLASACVIVDSAEREQRIRKALDEATRTIPGARWREDRELLSTVLNLTEFPSVVLGSFDPEFLSLPEEVLVTVMRDHQKYFAVEDAHGKLAPHFLAVLNTDSDPDGLIRHGNERVLRARFNDARFFWNTDQKHTLRDRVEWLKSVTFQKDLGSYYDKTCRVQKLASLIAETLLQAGVQLRAGVVHKAALMAKTDLTTELVKEFTELQGIVGGLYARAQANRMELSDEVGGAIGEAIYFHYKPESMDDTVPPSIEGAVLAIADKADTIAGMFALGMAPSGSKDPFALRRAANGIVKIIAQKKLPLSLETIFQDARTEYNGSEAEAKFAKDTDYPETIANFLRERIDFYLREVRGFQYDVVNAVLASGADDVMDAIARAEAIAGIRGSDDFIAISAAFKRMKNILKQAKEKQLHPLFQEGQEVTEMGLQPAEYIKNAEHPEEAALVRAYAEVLPKFGMAAESRSYREALLLVAGLRAIVDAFFDKVMVMTEDKDRRDARLFLLSLIVGSFSAIADFSEIVTERT